MTNMLQLVVLIEGVLYFLIGGVIFISPMLLGRVFGVPIAEDWFQLVKFDTFVAPLYIIARGFGAMVATVGAAMVLPLFDPLRYRGLIYYTGVIFPLLCSGLFLYNGIKYGHAMVIVPGALLALAFILTAVGLGLTKKQAGSGEE